MSLSERIAAQKQKQEKNSCICILYKMAGRHQQGCPAWKPEWLERDNKKILGN